MISDYSNKFVGSKKWGLDNLIANAGAFSLENFGGSSITGVAELGYDAFISVGAAIPNSLTVTSAETSPSTVIAAGTTNYELTSTDLGKLSVSGYTLSLDQNNNQITL